MTNQAYGRLPRLVPELPWRMEDGMTAMVERVRLAGALASR